MIEHYLEIKQAHMGLAAASVALYAARATAVLAGARWPMRGRVRLASVAIDTLLVAAGGTLWWLLSLHPARQPWLGAKLLLIVLYIVLGSFAIKRARTPAGKGLAFAASLLCIAGVAAIAFTHEPFPPARWLGSGQAAPGGHNAPAAL